MTAVSQRRRKLVRRRALDRCEYCQLSQIGQEATFHIDHIRPQARGGKTTLANLALACVSCSLRKGDREWGVDKKTKRLVRLFHPRRDHWRDHFTWMGFRAVGRTAKGRATTAELQLNRPIMLVIREEEAARGRFPP